MPLRNVFVVVEGPPQQDLGPPMLLVASIPQFVQPSSVPVVPNPTVIWQNPNVVQPDPNMVRPKPTVVQSNPTVIQQKAAVVQASLSPGNSNPSQASTASSSGGACMGSRIEIQWSGDIASYSWSGASGQTNTGECLSLGSNWERTSRSRRLWRYSV